MTMEKNKNMMEGYDVGFLLGISSLLFFEITKQMVGETILASGIFVFLGAVIFVTGRKLVQLKIKKRIENG